MDSMNLKDFKTEDIQDHSDREQGDTPLSGSNFTEEINALKIDKLSNKITIISIIIPVMISAILIFAYLDMKERVVDVDQTKQNQVDQISRELEEKLNALDVKIAKNRFDLETVLPEFKKKTTALDGRITKINQEVVNTAKQNKAIKSSIEQMNKERLSDIKSIQKEFEKTSGKIKEDITLFKEEFDARLLELSDYEQQIGQLRKDLSLLDKKYNRHEQELVTKNEFQMKNTQFRTDLDRLKAANEKQAGQLQDELYQIRQALPTVRSTTSSSAFPQLPSDKNSKPEPQIKIDSIPSGGISEKPLIE